MSSGTITLTNNLKTVNGIGTSFTDINSGDFIVAVVGGVTYTLPVDIVNSGTQITLIRAYDGPTTSGAAWSAVPRNALSSITAQLAADTATVMRGFIYDKNNWQQVFSASGNITVTLPDGSQYTGPSWPKVLSSLATLDIETLVATADRVNADASKVAADTATATTAANTATEAASAASTASVSIVAAATSASAAASRAETAAANAEQWARTVDTSNFAQKDGTGIDAASFRNSLGLGNSSTRSVGTATGTVASGDDARLNTINAKSGGTINGPILIDSTDFGFTKNVSGLHTSGGEDFNYGWLIRGHQSVDAKVYGHYLLDGSGFTGYRLVFGRNDMPWKTWFFRHDGAAVGQTWISTSDGRLKDNKEEIKDATSKVISLTGMSYDIQGSRRAGLIAQDVEKVLPEAVVNTGAATASDGTTIDNSLALDYNAVVALLVNAVKEQQKIIESLSERVSAFESTRSS